MDRNNLNRVPSKTEKIIGVIASAIAVLMLSFLCFAYWFSIFHEPHKAVTIGYIVAIIATLLLILSLFLLYRSLFTTRKKPGRSELIIASYALITFGVIVVLCALTLDLSLREKISLFSPGFICLSLGTLNLAKAKKHNIQSKRQGV